MDVQSGFSRVSTKIFPALALIFVLWLLTKISFKVKYFVKYIALGLYLIIMALLSATFGIYRPAIFARWFMKIMNMEWWFGLSITITNSDRAENCEKPCVIISNHQSLLDMHMMVATQPVRCGPLVKKSILFVPLFGVAGWLVGATFIDKHGGLKAIETLRKIGRTMRQTKSSIWIYPEGTAMQKDTIGPFKSGAFHLAIQAQVPVLPIVFSNTRNVLDTYNHRFDGGAVRVRCLEPVKTEGITEANVESLMEHCHKLMLDEFNKDYNEHKDDYAGLPPIKNTN